MLTSSKYLQGRGDSKSSRFSTAWKKLAAMIHVEESSAQRTQADHCRTERFLPSSSQEPRVYAKPDAMFSSKSQQKENICRLKGGLNQ